MKLHGCKQEYSPPQPGHRNNGNEIRKNARLVLVFRPEQARFKLPAGAVDAHCHVFGPGAEFPYAPERKYTPCDASKAPAVRAA
jgi:hypothetical protein